MISSIEQYLDQIPIEIYQKYNGMSINKIIPLLGLKQNSHTRTKLIDKLRQLDVYVKVNIHYSDEQLLIATKESTTYSQICEVLGIAICTINFRRIQAKQLALNCDVSHLYINNVKYRPEKIPKVEKIIPIAPDGYKYCQICTSILTHDNFTKDKSTKDGLYYACKECKHTITNERYLTHKYQSDRVKQRTKSRRVINNIITSGIKMEIGCVICREQSHHSVLEYHHINDDKQVSVAQSKGMSLVKIISEIQKCICLCANCHRKVHANILNVDSMLPISLDLINKVFCDNNIDINNVNYNIKKSTNTCWVYNKELDLQMKIPTTDVDDFIKKGYVFGIRPRGNKKS